MHIRRKKAFRQLFRLIREVEAHPEDLASVRELNLLVLKEVLRHVGGHQQQAAELLGISRVTLRSKLRALGMVIERATPQ